MNISGILILSIVTLLVIQCEGASKKMICRAIRKIDCHQYTHNENCGTNGITYINACHFAQAKCINESVKVAHEGHCSSNTEERGGFDLILQVPYTEVNCVISSTKSNFVAEIIWFFRCIEPMFAKPGKTHACKNIFVYNFS
ncbi:hypothetical protein LOTGIDRAFT_171042 [Lottia gigantea]|uniref:Kazal-like domain-containing protein n=1 Tax=Lottia gigantea TaxID=225164 RepID=V4AJ62_LOTGI|nr:hypothetical protein LOTGIDRAFT_171042 [Lottia gigantea]ESP04204.1 hypothetical protein LOTGIDRAFT_171042 [Lottia gigantea]